VPLKQQQQSTGRNIVPLKQQQQSTGRHVVPLKQQQQSTGRHVVPLGYIMLIPSKPITSKKNICKSNLELHQLIEIVFK
jgi:hypothetical protein